MGVIITHLPTSHAPPDRKVKMGSNAFFRKKRKEKEKTTPFGVNLMRSQVIYRAAQVTLGYTSLYRHLKAHVTSVLTVTINR